MTGTTPPPLTGPTAKEKKYDRQLRLWAASGQAALEESHILLINSGPGCVGVEALKNLVLPGIGNFTIQDSTVVSEADLGLNFFLDEDSLGKFRAEQCCYSLKELNPDVTGSFSTEPLESFLSKPDALRSYTLILVTSPATPEILNTVCAQAAENHVPVFYVHSVGFYSHFSIYLPPAFPIIDTHPDPQSTTDLRLLNPWPALSNYAYAKTNQLETFSDHEHGHVPWLLILLHFLEGWKKTHNGKGPQNYKEKTEFRELVRKGTRTDNPEGGEENFEEAVAAVLKSLNPSSVSHAVKEVFSADECVHLNSSSANFWIIANAISQFYAAHGELPLPGSVPDMKAQSADYIQLQNIYKAKAREDAAEVIRNVRDLEDKLGRMQAIDEKEIEAFCKGAGHVKLLRGRPFHIARPNDIVKWGDRARSATAALTNPESHILLYIAFLAYDSFIAAHPVDALGGAQKVPGLVETEFEMDVEKMVGIAEALVDGVINEAQTFVQDPEYSEVKQRCRQYVTEIVRAGGSELHNISSLTGGLVAQEIIKVITKQYIPVDNVCLYDGIQSTTGVLRV